MDRGRQYPIFNDYIIGGGRVKWGERGIGKGQQKVRVGGGVGGE